MRLNTVLGIVFVAIAAGAAALAGGMAWLFLTRSAAAGIETDSRAILYGAAGAALLVLSAAASWAYLHARLTRPMASLVRQTRTIARSRSEQRIAIDRPHLLGRLPAMVGEVAKELVAARRDIVKAMAGASARAEDEKSRLEAILIDLDEGVLVCSLDHRIVLYNRAAARLLEAPQALGLGRSLFDLVSRQPVLRTLRILEARHDTRGNGGIEQGSVPFACAALPAGAMLHGRMSLIVDPNRAATGYVLTFADITVSRWSMADLYSVDLLNCVIRRLKDGAGIKVGMTGMPLWLHGDGHGLVLALAHLIERAHADRAIPDFDVTASSKDGRVQIDIVWTGAEVETKRLDDWLEGRLEDAPTGETVRRVLDRHGGRLSSRKRRSGRACMRIELSAPRRIRSRARPATPVAPRPEYYDFELMARRQVPDHIAGQRLQALDYVVLDTETTGLRPSAGDEIVSIAGVRIVNGRILTRETFDRLVDPGRPIPKVSTDIHGIADEMVRGKPPIQVVLPQFRSFCGDAVLVAHNAAFDMKFIKLKEAGSGVVFDNPVLDTLLLSVFLHPDDAEHSLEAVARRFDVTLTARHTALGDAMVTAGIFVGMLEMLQARGVATLGQSLATSERIVSVRKLQARF